MVEVSQRAREAYVELFNPPAFDRRRIIAGEWDAVTGLQLFARFEAETIASATEYICKCGRRVEPHRCHQAGDPAF
ncbi:hypothetical protein [Sphingobium sp. YR768]|uniref:hypothetical protein n=1 Tax=Sphingobium sp. YR768 TaxID=1884365 RepID=UPI0008D82EA0|nr:hypothetical protein [Sphingobium sp. YR768]SES08926.1 hypothetical protein SAMN05518866_13760 [Sphingobium sp. YR768]